MWRGLLRLCLALLVTVGGCEAQAPSATGRSPTTGADASSYRRGVWLLLDQGENRHACDRRGAGRYRYIVVQWYATRDAACPLERIRAANPGVKVLAYQNVGAMIAGPHTNGRPSTCVTQEEAAAHDAAAPGDAWQLHDKTGNVLAFQDQYAYLAPGNVGRTSYQAQCLRRLARIKADGYDGVLGDDANVFPGHGLGEHDTPIAEYPTDAAYGDAMVRAMRRIGPGAAQLGLLMVPNVGADPGERAQRAMALAIVRASSGFFTEFWTRWEGAGGASQSGPAWEAGVTMAQEVEALGKPFLASTYHGPGLHGAAADQQYAVASFWLVWDGRQDSGWGYDVPGDPAAGFSPAWGPDIGAPLDPVRVRVGVGWRRRYVDGVAVVNPSQATPQRFELGASHRKPDGSVSATVILPPTSGMVLTRTASTPGGRA